MLQLLMWVDGGLCLAPFITAAVTLCHYVDQRSPALQPHHSFSALYANTARARVRDRRPIVGRIITALQAGQKRRCFQWCFVLCVSPPLHWGQMLWKWSSNQALGMTEWCRELDLQNLMTFDSCINRKQRVQLSVLFTWKRIQEGRAWWCKCFARICR